MPDPFAAKPIGLPFIELPSVESTNNYALEQVHAGLAQHGMAFFAYEQFAGKGRGGKVWTTEKGKNIILSVIVQPKPLALSAQFALSACTALSVYELFKNYAGTETRIKWPNDLYWQDRKAGGILIESIVRSRESGIGSKGSGNQSNWGWAVIGIGININQLDFPAEAINPVSLKEITGIEYNPLLLAKELCLIIDKNLQRLLSGGQASLLKEYNDHLYKRNESVKLKKDNRVFEALIKNVSSSGHLVVNHAFEEEYAVGDVEWII